MRVPNFNGQQETASGHAMDYQVGNVPTSWHRQGNFRPHRHFLPCDHQGEQAAPSHPAVEKPHNAVTDPELL